MNTVHGNPMGTTKRCSLFRGLLRLLAISLIISGNGFADTNPLDRNNAFFFATTAYRDTGLESVYFNLVDNQDAAPPVVAVITPSAESLASDKVPISISSSRNIVLSKVQFLVNGETIAESLAAPFLVSWDTSTLPRGEYVISVLAYDEAGHQAASENLSVTIAGDTIAPTVALAAPGYRGTASGGVVVSATARDNVAVAKTEIYLDDTLVCSALQGAASYAWDTLTATNGSHVLSARAYDRAGNVGVASPVALTVFNDTTAPVLSISPVSSPSAVTALTLSGLVSDNDAVASVTVQVGSGAAAAAAISGAGWSFPLKDLASGSNLVTVRATDRSGNSSAASATIIVQLPYTIQDAQLAMQIAAGLRVPTSVQLQRLDVAPIVNGKSSPNGRIDTADVVAILAKIRQ